MKKIITIVLTAVLALTAAFSLAACGDKEAESVTIAVPNDTTNAVSYTHLDVYKRQAL